MIFARAGGSMLYLKNIGIIARCSEMYRDERFAGIGINGRQSLCLLHVCRQPGITQDSLGKSLFIDKSNVTRQMSALEEAGYVKRRPDEEDRRQIHVYPTEKALAELPEIRNGFKEWREYLGEDLTEKELEFFCKTAEMIAKRAASYCGRIVTEEEV